jgi:HK97 family phage portal protein
VNLFGFSITKQRSGGGQGILDYIRGIGGVKGVNVNETTAMGLSAYYAGVRRISHSLAMLPIDVVKKQGANRIDVMHPSEWLLNSEASFKSTAFDFKQVLITSAINHGNGLAIIERNRGGAPTALINVDSTTSEPTLYDDELYWNVRIKIGDKTETLVVNDRDMINLRGFGTDEIVGLSAIKAHKQNLGLSLAAQKYGADFYENGTMIDGYIEFAGTLDADRKKAISDQWKLNYGFGGKGGIPVLDAGTKYTKLGLPPEDAQFIETRKFQKSEIATILDIPLHMINDMDGAKYSNVEQTGIEFVTYSLGGWIAKIEQEFSRKLLKENEKKDHKIRIDVKGLIRADIAAKGQFYRLMTDIGAMSINDVKKLEDMNPIEGGDEHYVQLNRIPISKINEYYDKENNKPD